MTRQQYYDWGVKMYGTPPSMDDIADLSRKLLPSQLCPVTRKGFSLNGVYYLPTVTSMETYFQRNTSGPPKQKRLSHDPSNVSDAWLWPDKSQRSESLEPLVLRPQDASYAGLSVAESKALHRLEKASNPAIDQEVLSSQVTSKLRRDLISAQELSDRRKDKRDLKLIASAAPEPVKALSPPVIPPRPAMPRLSIAQLIDRQKRSGTS